MISIVISEKGGSERRERFDKPEITIGRVKGNDVLLSKGNVSKRHARLLERDGRFIVTDLKSTNGTYVNHRRITHAVIREGDRIYIGDFVLWVAADDSGGVGSITESPSNDRAGNGGAAPGDSDPEPESIPDIPFGSPALEPARAPAGEQVVNHFPIEHDPDDSGPPANGAAAADAAGWRAPTAGPAATEVPSGGETTGNIPASANAEPAIQVPEAEPTIAKLSLPGDVAAELQERRATQQKWLGTLVERVERNLGADLARLEGAAEPPVALGERVRAEVGRALAELQRAPGWPAELDSETVRRAALAELLETGPLDAALGDDATTQVRIMLGRTEVTRRGRRQPVAGLDFTNDQAIGRAIHRLCLRAGRPMAAGEFHVSRQLPDGLSFSAVRPPAALRGHLLVVNKLRRSEVSLDGLVRGGTISRAMATMLAHCVATRANLLVVGAVGSGTRRVVDALVRSVSADQRTVWLSEVGTAASLPDRLAVVEVGVGAEEQVAAVESAASLEAEHMVVPKLGGPGMLALVDAIGQGAEGVILHVRATSLRQAIDRIGAELAASRPGLAVETARELLVSSFDIAVEVARVRDGRQRVSRLAELRATAKGPATRDVFVFSVHRAADGESVEGTFQPTGVVPTIVEELAGRGIALDTSIFRRHSSAH